MTENVSNPDHGGNMSGDLSPEQVETLAEALAGHTGVSFDLTTPRQYTAHGNWNQSCDCGVLLGDDEVEVEVAGRRHQAEVLAPTVAAMLTQAKAEGKAEQQRNADHRLALLQAVVSYDDANQSDLPLTLLDGIRAEVGGPR